jgi:hypothetical protein
VEKSSKNLKGSNMWCPNCDKNNHNTPDCRAIAKFKQQKNNKACFEAKAGPGKSLWPSFSKKLNALRRQLQLKPETTASSKKRKAEFILSTEINLTNRNDEGDHQKYLFTSSKPFSSSKTKLAKSSHLTIYH